MTTSPFTVRRFAAAFATGLLVPLTAALPAEAATPSAPTSLAPDSTEVSTNTPTLSWGKVSGGVKYEVQADDDPGFDSPNFTSSTVNNRAVPTKVLPNGEISWRVRAFNASNIASSWSVGSFTVTPAAAPTPVSPAGGTVLGPAEPPLLTWSALPGATSYSVEVDETSDFTTPITTQTTQSTSLVVPVPLQDGEFFWRVKASKGVGTDTLFSDPSSFVVSDLPAPVVVSPTSSVDFEIEDVVLDWGPVTGAEFYQLEVATDIDFNSLVSAAQTKVYGTRYSPAITYDNNQYFWRVRAVDTAANPGPWAQGEFNRVWPDHPEPVFPLTSGTPLEGDMYFEWTPVQHASEYELQLGTDVNFSPGTTENCRTAGTTYTPWLYGTDHFTGNASVRAHERCQVIPGTTYYWRVRALDRPFTSPGVESIYSAAQTFQYDDGDFTQLSPAPGATVAVPTLSWEPSRGADHYKLTIHDNTGTNIHSATTYSTSYTPVNEKLTAAKSPYTWSVTAYDASNAARSQIHSRTFSIGGTPPTEGLAPLAALSGTGADPATLRAPSLTWEVMAEADHYTIQAGVHGSNSWYTPHSNEALGKKLYFPAVTDTWTRMLSPGTYDWQVRAHNSSGSIIGWGEIETFTIAALPAATGQRIALNGTALDDGQACTKAVPAICTNVPATPVFDWAPVDGAGSYMIYVAEDKAFTNLTEPLTKIGTTSNTRWTPTMSSEKAALEDSDAGGSYFWFVRPCKTPTTCGPAPVSMTDPATNKFQKKSPAVQGLTTTGSATVDAADISFSWTDYRTTNAATTWAEDGEASTQSAKAYRIQVDNDPTFSSPLDNLVVDQATYTSAGKLYPDGELYWRVQAIDGDDNPLTWSVVQAFTKATAAPEQVAPAHSATVSGTVPFTWDPVPSAGSYEIAVYRGTTGTASSANLLFSKTGLEQAAYVWTKPIPASTTPYEWRVRRKDASNNVGPWSGWHRFTSTGSVPTLLTPASGTLQPARGPLFSWDAVNGAASYTIEGRSASSTSRPFATVTTAATAWAATAAVPDGAWQWRVTAKDAGGAVLGSSAWRGFTVDGLAPTVTSKSPTTNAYRTANFVAKFSEPVKNVTTSTFQLIRVSTGKVVTATVTLSADKRTATLNPGSNLVVGAYYTARLTSGVTDLAGNKLAVVSWKVKAT